MASAPAERGSPITSRAAAAMRRASEMRAATRRYGAWDGRIFIRPPVAV
jgi:hypothetical protein